MNTALEHIPFDKKPSSKLEALINQLFEEARSECLQDHHAISIARKQLIDTINYSVENCLQIKSASEIISIVIKVANICRDQLKSFFHDERTNSALERIDEKITDAILTREVKLGTIKGSLK